MKLREKFEKRHVCTWTKSFEHSDDYGCDMERECKDCGRRQYARITPNEKGSLPASLIHLGDWNWKEGAL